VGEEVLAQRAKQYAMTVQEYKTKQRAQDPSKQPRRRGAGGGDVRRAFPKTTGAQVPVDGAIERVI